MKRRFIDSKSGDNLWVVESLPRTRSRSGRKRSGVIAPFGGAEEMVKELREKVFPERKIRFLAVTKDGKQVRVA